VLQSDPVEDYDLIFQTKLTDSEGKVSFSWDEYQEGDLYVTVTKRNYRPHEGIIQIDAIDGYAIVPDYESLPNYINDLNGNNDGILNPGETIELNIPLSNFGTESISDITATLTTSSSMVNIIDSNSVYDNIEVNGSNVGTGFSLELSSSAVFNQDLDLILQVSYNNSVWNFYIPLSVTAPKIDINSFSSLEGEISPGNTVEMLLELQNNGNLDVQGLSAEMISSSNLINVINADINCEDIDAGETSFCSESFTLSFSESMMKGSVVPLEIHFTSQNGYDRSEYVSITIGEVDRFDPLGPDLYGYYIYDSGDTGYDLAPEYN
jgi:hypothetical protein